VANLRELFANDMKLSVGNINLELGEAPEGLKTCLNESVEASKVNYENALTKYTNCINHAENVAMAAKLAVNLTKIMTEAGNVSECDELRFIVIGLQTKLATIQEDSNLDLTTQKQIIDGVTSLLPGLEMKLLDCKYFGNNMGVIEAALQQQQDLQSIVNNVSNAEYLGPFQSQITSINSSLTNILNSPSMNSKQDTIFMLQNTQSTIDQIKSYVNVSKSNSAVTLNYHSNFNDFQNMANTAVNPNIVYGKFFSCITQYLTFSPFSNPFNFSKCLEGVDATTNTSLNYDQLKLTVANSQAMISQLSNEINLTLHSGLSFVETHINLISCYYTRIYLIWEKNEKLIEMKTSFENAYSGVLLGKCYPCIFLSNRDASESDRQKVEDCLKSCTETAKVLTENNRKDTENFITDYNAVSKTTYDNITNCVASLRSTI
jgi:hypothetical protein